MHIIHSCIQENSVKNNFCLKYIVYVYTFNREKRCWKQVLKRFHFSFGRQEGTHTFC